MTNPTNPVIVIGNIVSTNYDTGPYVITRITGPHTHPSFLDKISGNDAPSEPHYHMTCEMVDQPNRGEYYLNGYRLDGTSVWGSDRLILQGHTKGQMELFI